MNNYKSSVIGLFKRLVLVFLLYQGCRVVFYLFNSTSFEQIDLNTVIGGFWFDLSVITTINILFIIIHTLLFWFLHNSKFNQAIKIIFVTINSVFIATNLVDCIYFKYTGRRSSFQLITANGMEEDLKGWLLSFIEMYWYLFILFFIIVWIFWKLSSAIKTELPKKIEPKQLLVISLVNLLIYGTTIISARGGLQQYPISRISTIHYGSVSNSELILNTPFCIIESVFEKQNSEHLGYYSNNELVKRVNPIKKFNSNQSLTKKNVVIIILESFGSFHIGALNNGKGFTPFLDSLIKESLFFENGFANGNRSSEALPSILSSIPSLLDEAYVSSPFSTNINIGLPKIMKELGYHTSFFYGGHKGSNHLNDYALISGIENYYGKEEYPDKIYYDGFSGIFDEEFLKYFGQKLGEFKQPFFSTIFTLSSHSPFIIPEKYKGKFPKGEFDIQECVSYSDYSLKQFFNYARMQPWFKNTLFVLSADHRSWGPGFYDTSIGGHAIPILFYDPSNDSLKSINGKLFQQIDIFPSILDYIHYPNKFFSLGKSWKEKEEFVIYRDNNIFHFMDGNYKVTFDGKRIIEIFKWKTDKMQKTNLIASHCDSVLDLEANGKSFLQTFRNRLLDNKLYFSKEGY